MMADEGDATRSGFLSS